MPPTPMSVQECTTKAVEAGPTLHAVQVTANTHLSDYIPAGCWLVLETGAVISEQDFATGYDIET